MDNQHKHFIFVAGLHRSGTSLVHEILRDHPQISGFRNTGVFEDEGQKLQSVYPAASEFGGPGRFGFDPRAYMDERHALATREQAGKLFAEWSRYWDLSKPCLVEKSPPNLVRMRFLQQLFPNSSFVIILRHPVAVAYATRKWSKTSLAELIDHSLRCYERMLADLPHLHRSYLIHYENLVAHPEWRVRHLFQWLGLEPAPLNARVRRDGNAAYFARWRAESRSPIHRLFGQMAQVRRRMAEFEARADLFGYAMAAPDKLTGVAGLHCSGGNTPRRGIGYDGLGG